VLVGEDELVTFLKSPPPHAPHRTIISTMEKAKGTMRRTPATAVRNSERTPFLVTKFSRLQLTHSVAPTLLLSLLGARIEFRGLTLFPSMSWRGACLKNTWCHLNHGAIPAPRFRPVTNYSSGYWTRRHHSGTNCLPILWPKSSFQFDGSR
jgi:hypothetical protein